MNSTMVDFRNSCEDYQQVEQAILFLEKHYQEQPSLQEIAHNLGLSEFHFQRLFTRWVGISPKRFLQFLTKERAKEMLENSSDVLGAAYATGLSGPGRLHDLFVTCEAVTPGEYKRHGEDLEIVYGFHPTPFGDCLLGVTGRGICSLAFVQDDGRAGALLNLKERWKNASLHEDPSLTEPLAQQIFAVFLKETAPRLNLYLYGTNFQIKVWEALLRIPSGRIVSYEDLAAAIGKPGATRAVARAVSQNPIPVIIPCHRVIRKMGAFGGYRWGSARKKALIGWEMARAGEES